jgi:signal transduction histidine kinase
VTLSTFLNVLTQIIFLFIASSAVLSWLRRRDRARFDVAVVFFVFAVAIIAQDLGQIAPSAIAGILSIVFIVGLLLQPYLLLRVAQYFRPVSRRVQQVALVGLVLAGASVALIGLAPGVVVFIFLGYFLIADGYAAYLLFQGARHQPGLISRRLRLAALGAALLGSVFLVALGLSLIQRIAPLPEDASEYTGPLIQLIAIGSGLGYYLGFTPPRWLRQAWQHAELHRFLRETGSRTAAERARLALEDLCRAALRSVGGRTALGLIWNETENRFDLREAAGQPIPADWAPANDGIVNLAWRQHQPALANGPAEMGPAVAQLAEAIGGHAALAAPIAGPDHAWGVVLVLRAEPVLFAADDLSMLTLLSEQCAVALAYAQLLTSQAGLIEQLGERTAQLEAANKELEAFSYSTSHDLRAPLRAIDGFSLALLDDYSDKLDSDGQNYLNRIRSAAQRMAELIDALLNLAQVTRHELQMQAVDLSALARQVAAEMGRAQPERQVELVIADGLRTSGDVRLLRVVLDNLIGNAWKFTQKKPDARIEVGRGEPNGMEVFYVRDNGAGFDPTYAHKLFGVFQRLHSAAEFNGTGIGLATVQRVITRHGGKVWAEGAVGQGATIYFTLPMAA